MNNTRAVLSLNGDFVLATQYGGTPTHIGLDFGRKEPSVQGIIKAARFWEIGYVAGQHKDAVASLVPEARFTYQDIGSRFCVRVVKDKEEYYELVPQSEDQTDEFEFDVLPEDVVWRLRQYPDLPPMPLTEAFKAIGIDPKYTDSGFKTPADFLQALAWDRVTVSRRIELARKYSDMAIEMQDLAMRESDWKLFWGAVDSATANLKRNLLLKERIDISRKRILDTCTDPGKIIGEFTDQIADENQRLLESDSHSEKSLSPQEAEKAVILVQQRIATATRTGLRTAKALRKVPGMKGVARAIPRGLVKVRRVAKRSPLGRILIGSGLNSIPIINIVPWQVISIIMAYSAEKQTLEEARQATSEAIEQLQAQAVAI